MIWLGWALAGVLYGLGAVATILPAHEIKPLRRWRARYVMAFWPVFIAGVIIGAMWEGWTLWRRRHEQI